MKKKKQLKLDTKPNQKRTPEKKYKTKKNVKTKCQKKRGGKNIKQNKNQ